MPKENTPAFKAAKHPLAKKKFGQHFLVHQSQIDKIINLIDAPHGSAVLEIGPGPGTLTFPLHSRGFALTLVETDGDMVAHLQKQGFDPPLRLLEADFLQIDLDQVITEETTVVSNLPYNVSVPITAGLLRKTPLIPQMVLMYQKEVAERIAAAPGSKTYGQFSVVCQCLYHIRKGFDLSPGAFSPPPKVWSRVIIFDRREDPLLDLAHLNRLEKLLNLLFGKRRKMIGSILRKSTPGWTKGSALLESYLSCGFDPKWRPEVLKPDDYARWMHQHISPEESGNEYSSER